MTRSDFDYYFGVVSHRFCARAAAEYLLTVYGKGKQRKLFISLEDAVERLARLALDDVDDRPGDHVVYNQVTRAISIVEIAETIAEVAQETGSTRRSRTSRTRATRNTKWRLRRGGT